MADSDKGLVIVDVSNPATPTLKGSLVDTAWSSYGVAVKGNYAYIADYNLGLLIVDVSNPAVPIFKTSYYIPGYAQGVIAAGNYAYVAGDVNGLLIFRIETGVNLIDSYLPPGATPEERKAGLIRAMDDYFDNGTLTKAELLSVMDAYFA